MQDLVIHVKYLNVFQLEIRRRWKFKTALDMI